MRGSDPRRSAAGSPRKATENPVETESENLMGPGAESAPGPSFGWQQPCGTPISPLIPQDKPVSPGRLRRHPLSEEPHRQYVGRT